jgi:NAD(P)-dependent dehydrogenase (short-subunit alcohol dehydrogenase family)
MNVLDKLRLDDKVVIDVLVNNAGVGTAVPATRETPEEFRAVVDINLHGSYWAARACARVMKPGSSIVNI